jgi:protein O-GlcNAc transferase
MTAMTTQQAFELALQHHQARRLREAEQLYRQILNQEPKHAGAMHYLGVIAHQSGHNDRALALIRGAIEINPNLAEAYNSLGIVLQETGQRDEAVAAYRRAIGLRPNSAESHNNLGTALREKGQIDEAISSYRQAIALRSDYAEAFNNLGNALKEKGQLDEAIGVYRKSIALRPKVATTHGNLGNALKAAGNLDEAIAAYRQAVALQPNLAETQSNLGDLLKEKGELDEAIAAYQQAVALKPDFAKAHGNLGNVLKESGRLDEAIAAYRRTIALRPDFVDAHDNLVYTLNFHPAYDARAIAEESRRWHRQHAEPLRKYIQSHANDRSPDRRLRIGYVSADFRVHPVGRFLLPLFREHDHEQFEVNCYSGVRKPDEITARLKGYCDRWHESAGLSDEKLAEKIRGDGIDILIDLTMHMADNRLLVFARKPAPVQVTWLAYAGTTGMSAIDYRLSDPYLDPPPSTGSTVLTAGGSGQAGETADYAEQTFSIPCYWNYEPLRSPAVNALPAAKAGFVTFGCFNNFCKVSPETLMMWSQVLQDVERSHLLIHSYPGSHRDTVLRKFAENGIDPSRIGFVGLVSLEAYLLQYQQIDIALDTTPYAGGTTTCDALWMGVPTVTISGKTAVGRGGVSLLSHLGLAELIARTPQQYVQIAAALAKDPGRLQTLRSSLRQRMQASRLMDGKQFAQDIEAAYRQMWRSCWC